MRKGAPVAERGPIVQEIAEIDRQIADLQKHRAGLVCQLDEPVPSPQGAAEAWLDELDRTGQSPPPAAEAKPLPNLPAVVYPGGHRYERVEIARDDIPATCAVWIYTAWGRPEAHLAFSLVPFRGVSFCGVTGPPRDWWGVERKDMERSVELCAECARRRGQRLPGT
jgi:hypothetical protein